MEPRLSFATLGDAGVQAAGSASRDSPWGPEGVPEPGERT